MKNEKNKLLARVAYLYYSENKTQSGIAKILGVYRTTISRMLSQAKKTGIVKINIEGYDVDLLALEEYFRKKYGLLQVDITRNIADETKEEFMYNFSRSAANFVKNLVDDQQVIGISWGSTLSGMVEQFETRYMEQSVICPLAGGPSQINVKYHVNTLIYELAKKCHAKSSFINATVIQESAEVAKGILEAKYFNETLSLWKKLDVAIVGIGEDLSGENSQWRDLLTSKDIELLRKEHVVGECCCRFFDKSGKLVYPELQARTVGLPLEKLAEVPKSIAIAYGEKKAKALLAMIKKGYINCVVTDEATIHQILRLENDGYIN